MLTRELPVNVHLLTLEMWGENSALIRLEHQFAKSEDDDLSKNVTVSLKVGTQASVGFDGLSKPCPIAIPLLAVLVAHQVFAFWVGNCQKLELAPFDTCCPTSRQSIANPVGHRSPLPLCTFQ